MRPARTKPTTQDAVAALARRIHRPEADLLEHWAERAAVREFEGGQPRFRAEADALDDLCRIHERQRTFKTLET